MSGVRDTKGRAAALRRLWSWPLRRPRNLIIVLVGIVVVVAGASRGAIALSTGSSSGGHQQHHAAKHATAPPRRATPPSSSKAPAPAPPAPSSSTPPSRSTPTPTPHPKRQPSARQVAAEWAAAFEAHKGKTRHEWQAGLEPYSTAELSADELATVNPANVPGDAVTGHPTVTTHHAKDRHVRVPTNGQDLALVLVQTSNGWRVIDYQPAGDHHSARGAVAGTGG
jgi:pyruvate/2-oxoglutarate dehydrogenase complex dihydrolipoamide acyltransferase (E2) component